MCLHWALPSIWQTFIRACPVLHRFLQQAGWRWFQRCFFWRFFFNLHTTPIRPQLSPFAHIGVLILFFLCSYGVSNRTERRKNYLRPWSVLAYFNCYPAKQPSLSGPHNVLVALSRTKIYWSVENSYGRQLDTEIKQNYLAARAGCSSSSCLAVSSWKFACLDYCSKS